MSDPNAINYEKFPTWEQSLQDMYTQLLYTEMFGNTFYADEKQRLKTGVGVIDEFTKKEPILAAQIAVKARSEYYMRTMPIVALVYLSNYLEKEQFDATFKQIIFTPRDAIQFIDIARSGVARKGLGRKLKRNLNIVLADWLVKKGEFYATKYKNQLELIAKLTHLKTENPIMDYVFDNEEKFVSHVQSYPMINALEQIKLGGLTEEQIIDFITKNRLDWNTLKGAVKPTPKIWKTFMDNMSAIALIKNIASSERHLGDPDAVLDFLRKNLTVESLRRGKVLPLRLMQAFKMTSFPDTKRYLGMIANDYSKLYDLSNLGFVAICPDVSGSMTDAYNKSFQYSEMAGMFAGILARACKQCAMIPWDTRVYQQLFPEKDPKWKDVVYMYNYCRNANGGGTNMNLPIDWLRERRIKVDTFVLLTDKEEWAGKGWIHSWLPYIQDINPHAKAVLIRSDSYIRHQPYPPDVAMKANIYQMYGYTDQVFKILSML